MHQSHRVSQAVRYALMTGAAVVAVSYASTASAANANTPAQLQKITVTGTRIKRISIETAQPITRISRQQIQNSGYTNVGDLLGRLPFSGSHASSAGFSRASMVLLMCSTARSIGMSALPKAAGRTLL